MYSKFFEIIEIRLTLLVVSFAIVVRSESFTRSYVVGSTVNTIGSGELTDASRGKVRFTFWEKILSPNSEPQFSCGIKSDFQGNFNLRFDKEDISEIIQVTLRRNASTPQDVPLRAFFDLDQIENLRPSQVVVSVLDEESDSLGTELGKIEIIPRSDQCRSRVRRDVSDGFRRLVQHKLKQKNFSSDESSTSESSDKKVKGKKTVSLPGKEKNQVKSIGMRRSGRQHKGKKTKVTKERWAPQKSSPKKIEESLQRRKQELQDGLREVKKILRESKNSKNPKIKKKGNSKQKKARKSDKRNRLFFKA